MPVDNRFARHERGMTDPDSDCFNITIGSDFLTAPRPIYVGVSGDVRLVTVAGTTLTFKGFASGTVLPIQAQRVETTGTTATDLIRIV